MKEKPEKGLSRREFLKHSGAAVATGALSTVIPKRVSAARYPEELVVAYSGDPGHLDPRVEPGMVGWSILIHMYESCFFRDFSGKYVKFTPWLGEKYEMVSPTVMRWHLRKDVKFHNGEDFTAESVKMTFKEITAEGSRSASKMRLIPITELTIHDPHTIDIITKTPGRPLLGYLSHIYMMSPKAMRELGDKISANPVGTGQMKFVEYRPGQHVVMEANPDYYGKKSNFNRLRVRLITESGTRVASLEAGEVMFVNNVPPDHIPRLRANPNLSVVVIPTNRVVFIALRCDRPPFNDKRVRQAMNYAIDKEAITKGIMGGMAPIARAPLAQGVIGAHPGLRPYAYDPERAKKMLAEAGASGASFYLGCPNGRYLMDKQMGEAIAGYLSAVGLNVKFESPVWASFVTEMTKYEKCKYDGYLFAYNTLSGDPDWVMWDHFHSKALRRTMYSNPEVDRLLDAGREAFEEDKIKALYYKAQEIIWDECPWIFTYEQPDICAINKKLHWAGRPDEIYMFNDAYIKA